MKYFWLWNDSDFLNIILKRDNYRDIACRIVHGEPAREGLRLDRYIPEAVRRAIQLPWKWEEDPRGKKSSARPNITAAAIIWKAFDPRAREALGPLLEGCGEWIDISQGDDRYWLFIPTMSKDNPAPLPECPHWFESDESYVSEEFLRVYKENNLTGLRFMPVDENFKPIFPPPTPYVPVDIAALIRKYQEDKIDANDFINEVFGALAHKLNDSSASRMQRYPKDIRIIWCAYRYESELGNGGMAQTFYNMGHLLPCAEEAFRALGKIEQAEIIAKQRQMVQEAGITLKTSEDWWELSDEVSDGLSDLWNTEKYEDLDAESKDFYDPKALADYVIAHPKYFIAFKQV